MKWAELVLLLNKIFRKEEKTFFTVVIFYESCHLKFRRRLTLQSKVSF